MADPVRDALVRDAFVALEEAVLSETRLAGIEAAYVTVRRRRRNRLAVVAAIVVVALLPAIAFAALRSGGPAPVATTPPTPTATTTPTAPPSPSTAPTPYPTPALPAGVTPMRVTLDVFTPGPLDEARLEVPPFLDSSCPSGPIQFHDRAMAPLDTLPAVVIGEVATGDVTGDGEADHVAILSCRNRSTDPDQVVRQIVVYTAELGLVGQVISLAGNTDVRTPRVLPDGTIRVNARDIEPVRGPSEWRSYRWTGGASFAPAGTPVPIPETIEKSQLSVVVTPTPGGIVVTVHNGGTTTMAWATVGFRTTAPLQIRPDSQPENLVSSHVGGYWLHAVRIEPIAPGTTVAGRFLIGESTPGDIAVNVLAVNEDDIFRENADNTNAVTAPIPVQ